MQDAAGQAARRHCSGWKEITLPVDLGLPNLHRTNWPMQIRHLAFKASKHNRRAAMNRKRRIQFPGAVYHVVTRGDGRRKLSLGDEHYAKSTKGLRDRVGQIAWQVLASCWMPNHVHLLLTTPEPNRSYGMQHSVRLQKEACGGERRPTSESSPSGVLPVGHGIPPSFVGERSVGTLRR